MKRSLMFECLETKTLLGALLVAVPHLAGNVVQAVDDDPVPPEPDPGPLPPSDPPIILPPLPPSGPVGPG